MDIVDLTMEALHTPASELQGAICPICGGEHRTIAALAVALVNAWADADAREAIEGRKLDEVTA